ncbi:PREDICTED: prolyl endopeptidase-like [Camelina sativa]|uniref:Prolyl endopeptidase n=1 Tax=Camelina sativa TaxID=90675 RepID=A0ABM0WJ09_CAMSA|nr:PREDICTED: prolyl endopeptidase-like [Camelina sativa]
MLTAFASHARSHVFAFVTVPTVTRRLRINTLSSRSRRISSLSSSSLLISEKNFSNHRTHKSVVLPRSRCCSTSAVMGSSSVLGDRLHYPDARRDDSVVDDYHGVKIVDPYRWLEDPDAEEVKQFVENQVKLTDSVLEKCATKEKLRQNITKLIDHPRYDSPFRQGNKYFYFHNTGLQAQSVLYMQDDLDAEPEVLLDPNTLSDDGTVALNTFSVSEDAKYLAYGLSASGSDWVIIKLMKIEDKKVEPDTLSWVKFTGITWTHDSKGFFYGRYPAPKEGEDIDAGTETNSNLYHELYYHFLGTDQSQDILCWRDHENPKYLFGAEVTDDGKYLVMSISEGCDPVNKLYYCDMTSFAGGLESFRGSSSFLPFIKLVDNFDAQYSVISNDETLFTFLTNKDAPKYKLVRVDLKEPNSWTDVVEEHEKDVLASACAVNGNQLVACYMSDVKHILQIRDLKSGSLLHQLPLDIGSVSDVSARRKDNSFFFSFTSFLTPGVIYKCDLANESPEVKVFREVTVPGFDREAFQATQVFYPSKDGTKIPMFIVAKKNIKLDGSHPCLLYAYGGFNISITPSFSASRIVLSKHLGVVFCFANIRGGGEYGEEWHKAGSLAKKQNCFDDFISGGEYLVSAGYTQPSKLCIEGGSNGGLLVGACINQRPDLFGCALAHVGVMDMLRFHKFTIGHAWTSDYGCSENEEEFQWLIKYSPLHNVKRPWEQQSDHLVQYPSTMLLTADHDDRVVPLHSLKLLATLQHVLCTSLENSPQTNPIIGRIEVKAGHGAGRPTQKMIDEAADRYAFMAKMVNASWTE